jgi:hypothetical protein
MRVSFIFIIFPYSTSNYLTNSTTSYKMLRAYKNDNEDATEHLTPYPQVSCDVTAPSGLSSAFDLSLFFLLSVLAKCEPSLSLPSLKQTSNCFGESEIIQHSIGSIRAEAKDSPNSDRLQGRHREPFLGTARLFPGTARLFPTNAYRSHATSCLVANRASIPGCATGH